MRQAETDAQEAKEQVTELSSQVAPLSATKRKLEVEVGVLHVSSFTVGIKNML